MRKYFSPIQNRPVRGRIFGVWQFQDLCFNNELEKARSSSNCFEIHEAYDESRRTAYWLLTICVPLEA